MRIKFINISNIKGVADLSFAPGTLTVCEGMNSAGKSSVLDAILAIFQGGHDGGMLRKGAKKGVVSMVLEDEKTGKDVGSITKTITAAKSTLEVLGDDGEPVAAPQSYVNSLAEALAVNPARLLAAEPKQILAELLDLCPMSFTKAEIEKVAGMYTSQHGVEVNLPEVCDLPTLDKLREAMYEKRKSLNKAARDAEGTVRDLQKSLPGGEEKDWNVEIQSLEKQLKAATTAEQEELDSVKGQAQQARDEIKNGFTERERKLRDDFQTALTSLNKERDDELEPIAGQEAEELDGIRAEYAPKKETVAAGLATARERAKQQEQARGQLKLIEQFSQKARYSGSIAESLTLTIEALDKLKKDKLDNLPVAGLTVQDGKVLVDGVEWEHVNTARQVSVAFELCAMRTGKLPFLIIDGAEAMDSETWEQFKLGAKGSGFQVIAAKVSDGPLTISVEN